jgi:hypothetical protein
MSKKKLYLLTLVISLSGVVALSAWLTDGTWLYSKPNKDYYFHKVDHGKLLIACRYVLTHKNIYRTNRPEISDTNRVFIDFQKMNVDSSNIPKEILRLKPLQMVIDNKVLVIIVRNGLFIKAFPDVNNDQFEIGQDDEVLIEGLYLGTEK